VNIGIFPCYSGNIVGAMGLYLNLPASATVVAADACLLFF
jgi:hypothetical protein